MSDRYQPTSVAELAGYPDPAEYSVIVCPYCIDAREMGVGLGGCLRHVRAGSSTEPEKP